MASNYQHKTIKGKEYIRVSWDTSSGEHLSNYVPKASIKLQGDGKLEAGASVRVKYGRTDWTGKIEARERPAKRGRPASDFVEGTFNCLLHLVIDLTLALAGGGG